jgi:hypothetical protein
MKNIIIALLSCFLFLHTQAQSNPDSLAYQLQRTKINSMLAQRSLKFGQYDQSLNQHTGIFGLQTKKDIKRSNDILMDIVKTDNDIYDQLKVLLTYQTFQQTKALDKSKEAETKSKETETYNIGFMNAVNRLRGQNEKLQEQLKDEKRENQKATAIFIMVGVLMFVSIILLLRDKYKVKM